MVAWTEDRVDDLRDMVQNDVPYDIIAEKLETTVGSVCGKVARLGIGKGITKGSIKPASRRPTYGGGGRPPNHDYDEVIDLQADEARRPSITVSWDDAGEHHCKFIVGDSRRARVCAHHRVPGLPYCEHHATRCLSNRILCTPDQLVQKTKAFSRTVSSIYAGNTLRNRACTDPLDVDRFLEAYA